MVFAWSISWLLRFLISLLFNLTDTIVFVQGTFQNAKEPPFINIPALENSIQLRNLLVEKEKFLLTRSYPGLVGQPIENIDGISSPHLLQHYPYPQPQNNLEVQQSMKVMSLNMLHYWVQSEYLSLCRTYTNFLWLSISARLLIPKSIMPTAYGTTSGRAYLVLRIHKNASFLMILMSFC